MQPHQANQRVRAATASDLPRIHGLIHATIDASYATHYPPRAVGFFKQFHSMENLAARHQTGDLLVLDADGALAATGALMGHEILGVFVRRDLQGHGHGRAIMRALEARAESRGIREITLSVSLPSRRFYERLGYTILEAHAVDVGEGQRLEYWTASLALKPVAPAP